MFRGYFRRTCASRRSVPCTTARHIRGIQGFILFHARLQKISAGHFVSFNPSDLNYSHQLHCDPTNTFEPLIMNARRSKSEVYFENTNKYTLLSAFYTIHLRPPLYLRNSLPINIQVSVAGCSVRKEDGLDAQSSQRFVDRGYRKEDFLDYGEKPVNSGDVLHLPTVRLASKGKESKSFLVVRVSISQIIKIDHNL